jgi:formylglycine-generating enzyme required for sulfatase activity
MVRLDEEVKQGKITPAELLERIRVWHEAHPQNAASPQAASMPQSQPAGLNTPPAPAGDRITAGGDIGHGSNMGGGTLTQRDVIGRDQISNSAQQITHVNIEHVGQMTLPSTGPLSGTDIAAKVSPNGSQPGVSEPQRRYLKRLMLTARRVPLGQLDLELTNGDGDIPEIDLDNIYVPLDTNSMQPAVGEGVKVGAQVPVPVLAEVISHQRLAVLGDPGSGKSTLLNYLTVCLCGARLNPEAGYLDRLNVEKTGGRRTSNWRFGTLLPVRVDLRDFAQDIPEGAQRASADLLWKHIEGRLASSGQEDFAPELKQAIKDGGCLILLDGLDEVSDKNKRGLVRDSITAFADAYSENRFLVTCRILSYTDPAWRLSSFPDVTLARLSKEAITAFIDRWYGTLAQMGYMDSDWNKSRAEELRGAALNLIDLASNPMLLTVMAVVHTYRGELPREQARLYNDCVTLLLWTWQRKKQIGPGQWEGGILDELKTREERLVNGLCEVAYNAHRVTQADAEAYIPQTDILDTLKVYLDGSWDKAAIFCDYVENRAGLLIGRGTINNKLMYSFPHRGFQEFLAGRYVVAGRDFARRAVELCSEGDLWHEVLMLAVGHMVFNLEEVTRALDAANLLCPPALPEGEAGWRGVWWASEILRIVGTSATEQDTHVGAPLLPRVIQNLSALVQGGHLAPPERAKAGDALGLLGDPRKGVLTPDPLMLPISGGAFDLAKGTKQQHTVILKPCYVSAYPVTNAQFKLFADKDYNDESLWTEAGKQWRKRTGQLRGFSNHATLGIANRPVVGITWHEAVAYANWLRRKTRKLYRLLTEAEWERAAAGPDYRKYAWGSRTSDDTANTREAGIGTTTAVGIFPHDKTPEGVYDLGGNVWEWTSSIGTEYPYTSDGSRDSLEQAGPRILRGGNYDSERDALHNYQRRAVDPGGRTALIGFRVAMDVG